MVLSPVNCANLFPVWDAKSPDKDGSTTAHWDHVRLARLEREARSNQINRVIFCKDLYLRPTAGETPAVPVICRPDSARLKFLAHQPLIILLTCLPPSRSDKLLHTGH